MMTEHQRVTGTVMTDNMANAERHAVNALEQWFKGEKEPLASLPRWRLSFNVTALGTLGFEVDYEWEYMGW